MTTHTSETILNKIRAENIKPKARWYFIVQHAALWIPAVLVTALGAVAFAGELYAVTHSGWEVREFIYPSQVDFLLATMPTLWVAAFIVFGSFIVKAFRTTHTGYRLSVKFILIGSAVTSIVVGTTFFYLDQALQADSIIRYPIHEREQEIWFSPIDGRLSGVVEEAADDSITIRDKENTLWTIDMRGFGTTTFPFISEGKSVRVIGTSSEEEHAFIGCAIFPWEVGAFNRPPLSPQGKNMKPPRIRPHNQNPDCVALLQTIKDRVRGH